MSNTCEVSDVLANYCKAATDTMPSMVSSLIHSSVATDLEHTSHFKMISSTLNIVDQLLMLVLLIGISWKCLKMKLEKTAMHAWLCTLGFMFLLAEGVMVRYNENPMFYMVNSRTKTKVHMWLQVLGGTLGLIGTWHKMLAKKIHFHTTHGKYGLVACIFCLINICVGFCSMYANRFGLFIPPLLMTIIHNVLGIITFFTAVIAQYYGYETGFFRRNFNNPKIYKIFTLVIMTLTLLGPVSICVNNIIKYVKN